MAAKARGPVVTPERVATWLASGPGLFEAKTPRGVWGRAWRSFSGGWPYLDSSKFFFSIVQSEGYGPRRLGWGTFILDRVKPGR